MGTQTIKSRALMMCALLAFVPLLRAQTYPSRPITIVVPLAAGDSGDIAARAIGEEISRILKTPVVTANRPGAGGALAAETVAKAAPDGYTILFTQNSSLTYRPVTEQQTVPYDPLKDLTPLGLTSRSPMVLAVRREAPYRTFKELTEFAKARRGQVRLGTPGSGSAADFSINLMNALTDAGLVSVPFNGASPAVNALRGEHIEGVVLTLGVVLGHIRSGALRGLTASDKMKDLPEVPTMQEIGYPQGIFGVWFAFLAPSGTSPEVVRVLVPAIRTVSQSPAIVEKLSALGIIEEYAPPESVTIRIREEQHALRSLLKSRDASLK
jgi:tripartite-type tricarboxylate transporter receptor subunit TctC